MFPAGSKISISFYRIFFGEASSFLNTYHNTGLFYIMGGVGGGGSEMKELLSVFASVTSLNF